MPKNKLSTKIKSIEITYIPSGKENEGAVIVTSSKIRLKLINEDRSINYKFLAYFFLDSTQPL